MSNLKKIIINENNSIEQCIKKLNANLNKPYLNDCR